MNKAKEHKLRQTVAKMSLREKCSLCSGADHWHTEAIERLGIEPVWMADGPHGLRIESDPSELRDPHSRPATCFLAASALACSFDRGLAGEIGEALAVEAAGEGVELVLGPGVNIKRNPLCGRNFEYFSEDPYLAGEMAAAQISGIQRRGVGACIKHYAVNNQEDKRMIIDSCVDNRALHEIYLEAFRIAIEKAAPYAVMSSYNKVNGEYAGESRYLMEEVLREKFGFDGAVISDWSAVCDRAAGIRAGLDLEMPGKASGNTEELMDAVRDGELDEADIDNCVVRLLDLVGKCKENKPVAAAVDYDHHHELSRRAAAESAVLLKNNNHILPFNDGKPFAVIGRFAESPRYQGAGSSRVNAIRVAGVLEELTIRGIDCPYAPGYNEDGSTNDALVGEARQLAVETGRAVIFAGLPDSYESEGYDREHLRMPDGMLKLIDVVSAACENTVVYLMLGAPVSLPFVERIDAIVCGYLGGQAAGAAAVDVITGRANPGGRLAETWPMKLSDIPSYRYYGKNRRIAEYAEGIYVGYRYYSAAGIAPLFPFGHGLSYTDFRLDAVSCDRKTLGTGEKLTVTLRVTNTGKREGSTVVQVYVAKKGDSYRQLRQFEKVQLFAGESRIVAIELSNNSFARHNSEADRRCVEMGDYTILVGTSSSQIAANFDVAVFSDDDDELPAYFSPDQATDLDEQAFAAVLGYSPREPDRFPYTLNSTIGDLRQRTVGKILYGSLMTVMGPKPGEDSEAADRRLHELDNVPIRSICAMSKGMLSRNKAKAVVAIANRKLFRGMKYGFKK